MGRKLVHVGLRLTLENISTNDKKSKSTCTIWTVAECATIFKSLISFCNDFHLKLTLKQIE